MAIGALAANATLTSRRCGYRIARERLEQVVDKLVVLTPEESAFTYQ